MDKLFISVLRHRVFLNHADQLVVQKERETFEKSKVFEDYQYLEQLQQIAIKLKVVSEKYKKKQHK